MTDEHPSGFPISHGRFAGDPTPGEPGPPDPRSLDYRGGGPGYEGRQAGPPRHLCICGHIHPPAPPGQSFLSWLPDGAAAVPAGAWLVELTAVSGAFHPTDADQPWLDSMLALLPSPDSPPPAAARAVHAALYGLVLRGEPVGRRAYQAAAYRRLRDVMQPEEEAVGKSG